MRKLFSKNFLSFIVLFVLVFLAGCVGNKDENSLKIEYGNDFYQAVNQEWLHRAVIPEGEAALDSLAELDYLTQKQTEQILMDLLRQDHIRGSKEQKLADFYRTTLDVQSRNASGASNILPSMKRYQQAETIDELIEAEILSFKEMGTGCLFAFSVFADMKDNSQNALIVSGPVPGLNKILYHDEQAVSAYMEYMTTLLMLCGEDRLQAQRESQLVLDFEKELAELELTDSERRDPDLVYHPYTVGTVNQIYPEADIAYLMQELGYPPDCRIIITSEEMTLRAASYFRKEKLDVLKAYAKLSCVIQSARYLSEDFVRAADRCDSSIYGFQGNHTNEQRANHMTRALLPDYLGELYIQNFFSEQEKGNVEDIIDQCISIYKKRMADANWLSPQTRRMAIRKLEAMSVVVGYPKQWENTLDGTNIASYEDNGSLLFNVCEIRKANRAKEIRLLSQPQEVYSEFPPVYETNAYYLPERNQIVFPAAILQPPFYNPDASLSENMGAIGVVIAHEITHAFDAEGAKYDEIGNVADWWTREDYQAFEEKQKAVIAFYDGLEVEPGIVNDGNQTLSENIADLGGMSCALELLKSTENADYKAFFRAWAIVWRTVYTPEYLQYFSETAPHSLSKIRVNRTIGNFQEFYDAYRVKEGDSLYVSPEQRVTVW